MKTKKLSRIKQMCRKIYIGNPEIRSGIKNGVAGKSTYTIERMVNG